MKPFKELGLAAVTDANRLVTPGKALTILCGFDNEFARADHECVRLDWLLVPTRVMLLTVLNYLQGIP